MTLHTVLDAEPDDELILRVLDAMVADELSPGSLRLLPALYPRLVKLGVHHAGLPRVAGFYRQTRGRNLLLAHSAGLIQGVLYDGGVTALLERGLATAVGSYIDLGTRPTDGIDLVIPADADLNRVEATLAQTAAIDLARTYASRAARVFTTTKSFSVAIRRAPSQSSCSDGASAVESASASIAEAGTTELAIVTPEQRFADSLDLGVRNRRDTSPGWAADAVTTFASTNSFEWASVQRTADIRGNSATLQTGIDWLATEGLLRRHQLLDRQTELGRVVQLARRWVAAAMPGNRAAKGPAIPPDG